MKKMFFILLLAVFSLNTSFLAKSGKAFATTGTGAGDGGSGGGGGGGGGGLSYAYSNEDMESLICNALGFLTGGVGKSLAAFACIGVSLAFLGGKVSWTLILTFAVGMACIFGAPTIIKAFAGGSMACASATNT